jgi:hypothetical protein
MVKYVTSTYLSNHPATTIPDEVWTFAGVTNKAAKRYIDDRSENLFKCTSPVYRFSLTKRPYLKCYYYL